MALNSSTSDCSNDSTLYINNEKEAADLLYAPVEVVFASIIVPCMMAFGFLSNSAFIFTVCRTSKLRTITNAYLVNMAVADLVYIEFHGTLYFVLPFKMSLVKLDVPYGQIGCIIRGVVGGTCYYTSFILITCVAVERFLAICHPLYQQVVSGKSHTLKIIVASWLLGGIFAISLIVPMLACLETSCIVWPHGDKYLMLPRKISFCAALPGYPILLTHLGGTISYLLACFVNFLMYANIIITLKRRSSHDLGTSENNFQYEVNQVARLLITNGAVFFLCFTPWQIGHINRIITDLNGSHLFSNRQHTLFLNIGHFMSYVNSSINPFVYVVCSSSYRNAYLKAFGVR